MRMGRLDFEKEGKQINNENWAILWTIQLDEGRGEQKKMSNRTGGTREEQDRSRTPVEDKGKPLGKKIYF